MSGSDANESQVKIIWYYNNVLGRPQKKKLIARHRGYHGATVMSGSLTGLPFYHTAFDMPVRPVLHTTAPHHYWQGRDGETEQAFAQRCADDLEAMGPTGWWPLEPEAADGARAAHPGHRSGVRTDELILGAYGEAPPARPRRAVQTYVSNNRPGHSRVRDVR